MTRAPLFVLALLVAVTASCRRPPPQATIEIAESGQVSLAVTEAELFDELRTLIVLMYFDPNGEHSCAALVDEGVQALNDRVPSARQAVALRGEEASDSHVFGAIPASGRYSFLLLGSHRAETDFRGGEECQVNADCASGLCRERDGVLSCDRAEDVLSLAVGNVVAVGCEELNVVQTYRTIMPVRLFPAGLR